MHFSVLLNEVIELLDPKPGNIILDATMGGGGYSEKVLEKIIPGGELIGVDRDPEAVERVERRLIDHRDNITFINDNFRNIDNILRISGKERLDGAMFDLGVSSFHLDIPERGFSFLKDGPLDMRFDPESGVSAKDVVNKFGRAKIEDIIKTYGEERHAGRVARAICEARRKKTISSTVELTEIIKKAIGHKYYKQRLHPATRTFQALRIYVNDEIESLREAVVKTIDHLSPGGRLCIVSFHSLEDRVVKNIFREKASENKVTVLTKKPVCPKDEEIRENPRSRSAKLRALEKKHEAV